MIGEVPVLKTTLLA